MAAINSAFGSFAGFQEKIASSRSGPLWFRMGMAVVRDGKLAIDSTPNQDTPYLLSGGGKAVLGLDSGNTPYYLEVSEPAAGLHQAWWNVVKLGQSRRTLRRREK